MIRSLATWALTVFVCLSSGASAAHAQGQLTGTFVRYVAIGDDGTMICNGGTCVNHSMQYAENATDTPSCDLYYPGSPVESFTVQAMSGTASLSLTNWADPDPFYVDSFTTVVPTAVSGRTITWSGTAPGGIRIDQTLEMQSTERYVLLTVRITNTGATALTDVYYLRNGDPDFGECGIGLDFETYNDVRRQPPTADSALATARAGDMLAPDHDLVLGIGAHDPRARVHNGGFDNTDASGEWTMPLDSNGMYFDEAVDIIFREPMLAGGASTTFEILYVWGRTVADVEARFDDLGFPSAPCTGMPEGASCTTSRLAAGTCRSGHCCTGCWDGAACHGGTWSACGTGGVACASAMGCVISSTCVAGLAADPTSLCRVCDPARSTTDWSPLPAGSACGAPSCAGGSVTTRSCDASGSCVAAAPTACATATCADATMCLEPCMAGACPMGRFCNTMTMLCEPVRSNGAACSEAIACTTGNCIDGVCCNDACADTCERCNLRGSEGTCLAIAAGTDPDNECDGTCDGAGGCIGGTPDAGPAEPDAGTALADGGPTPVVDGGSVDRDAGTAVTRPRSDDAGCGCTVPGASHGTRGVGAVLVAAIVLGVRRRRKRRRPTASARPDTSPLW